MNKFDKLHAAILDRPLVAWTLAAIAAAEWSTRRPMRLQPVRLQPA